MVDSNGKAKCVVNQSGSQYRGIRRAINHAYIFKSANSRNNEKRDINIYYGNGENSNCGETDAWYQNLRMKNHHPQGI